MKRLFTVLLLLCLISLPAMAENEYFGKMEVINCSKWVSLRKTPSATSKQLVKVPLGAVVTDCQQYGKDWIYAVYGGHEGYILNKYLQPCEGVSVYSAMLVTDGADLYDAIGALEPDGFIPADTILRNCAVYERGRAYGEYGSRGVYVNAEHVVPYNELSHFPGRISLHCNLYSEGYEGPSPALKADDTRTFDLTGYDYSEYDHTQYMLIDEDTPRLEFVLHSDTAVNHVHLFSVSLASVNDETGEAVYDAVLEHIQYRVDPEHPLAVTAVVYGDTPNWVVGYEDWTGAYHFAFVEISGEDGSLLLREF